MNFTELLRLMGEENTRVSMLVNLAADLAMVQDDVVTLFKLIGICVFLFGLWRLIGINKPNSQATLGGVSLQIIGGSVLYQLMFWIDQSKQSLWGDMSAPTAMGYVEASKSAMASENMGGAVVLAALSISVVFGVIFTGVGVYKFFTAGNQQDRHRSMWVALWMFAGGLMMIYLLLFANDIIASMMGMDSHIITEASF